MAGLDRSSYLEGPQLQLGEPPKSYKMYWIKLGQQESLRDEETEGAMSR